MMRIRGHSPAKATESRTPAGRASRAAALYAVPAPEARKLSAGDDLSGPGERGAYEAPNVDWASLVRRVRNGDECGLEELYRIFSHGVRFHLCRHLGPQELDDKVHDTFLIVVQAIQRGDLREPERLMGFVRTIVRRQVAAYIDEAVHRRREQLDLDTGVKLPDDRRNPEDSAITKQTRELIRNVLRQMLPRDREILTRFYLHEQTQEQICEEMTLTETQFRLLKSRAKARFGDLGRKKMQQRALYAIFLRSSASGMH
jgi:RNA polymerase sigma-70 factor, ECF subfamily